MSTANPDDGMLHPVPITRLPRRSRLASPLPAPPTGLIGRETEIAAVAAMIADPDIRLVTLTGPGGVGKTRLALASAAAARAAFPDGAAFVDLAPVIESDLVPSTIARALGVREAADEPPIETVQAYLHGRDALLILDNFEHLLDAAILPSTLSAACSRLTIMVTSRTRLRLSGEHVVPVAPLALPDQTATSSEVAASAAVRLFVTRARAANPAFRLDEAESAAVAAVCQQLDGLPLAIELAAARAGVFSPAMMLDRLERRAPLPLRGPRDVPLRQQTLHDAIAWSHDLLSPEEQILFRRLAVFVGGATIDAAEAVAAGRSGSPSVAIDGIVALVEQGLLKTVRPVDNQGDVRYTMLETVRAFAQDRLVASGEEPEILRHHAAWCLALVERMAPRLWQPHPGPWLDQLDEEIGNLRAALAWSLEAEPETALRIASGLWQYWMQRNGRAEGRSWLERGLAHAATTSPAVHARALLVAGAIASAQDDMPHAISLLEASHELHGRLDDRGGIAQTLLELGEARWVMSEYLLAGELLNLALLLLREPEDTARIAHLYNILGNVFLDVEDYDRADAAYRQALALGRNRGNPVFEAKVLINMGLLADDRGSGIEGAAITSEALAILRGAGDPVQLGYALHNVGGHALILGDVPRSLALRQEALEIALETRKHELVLGALWALSELAVHCGRPNLAARLLGASDAIRDAHGIGLKPRQIEVRDENLFPSLKSAIGEAALAAGMTAGRLASLDVIVADALALTAPSVVNQDREQCPTARVSAPLTEREREVLRLLVEGRTDKEIAAALFISRPTVSKHVDAIRGKLGVDTRTAAVAFAVRHHLA